MIEKIINFTTTGADEDILDTFVKPAIMAEFGDRDSYYFDIQVGFTAEYTGDVTINGRASKASFNTVINFEGDVESIVIETTATSGQVRLRF